MGRVGKATRGGGAKRRRGRVWGPGCRRRFPPRSLGVDNVSLHLFEVISKGVNVTQLKSCVVVCSRSWDDEKINVYSKENKECWMFVICFVLSVLFFAFFLDMMPGSWLSVESRRIYIGPDGQEFFFCFALDVLSVSVSGL